ncbi:unnamed protein product [Heterosigma akashiwo]
MYTTTRGSCFTTGWGTWSFRPGRSGGCTTGWSATSAQVAGASGLRDSWRLRRRRQQLSGLSGDLIPGPIVWRASPCSHICAAHHCGHTLLF